MIPLLHHVVIKFKISVVYFKLSLQALFIVGFYLVISTVLDTNFTLFFKVRAISRMMFVVIPMSALENMSG